MSSHNVSLNPNSWKKGHLHGLTITRRVGERVLINRGEIEIEVVDIRGSAVRIAFRASKEIQINRAEALETGNHT